MKARTTVFGRAREASVRDLTQQMNEMRGDLNRLRSSDRGLQRGIYAPQIRVSRARTLRTTTSSSPFERIALQNAGNLAAGGILEALGYGDGGSFYDSASQTASHWLTLALRSGRIR